MGALGQPGPPQAPGSSPRFAGGQEAGPSVHVLMEAPGSRCCGCVPARPPPRALTSRADLPSSSSRYWCLSGHLSGHLSGRWEGPAGSEPREVKPALGDLQTCSKPWALRGLQHRWGAVCGVSRGCVTRQGALSPRPKSGGPRSRCRRAGSCRVPYEEDLPQASPLDSGDLLVTLAVPWLIDTSPQLCSVLTRYLPVHVCVQNPLFRRTPVLWD